MKIIVKSNINSIEASRILEEAAASIESQGLGSVERTNMKIPGTKGTLLNEIIVQLALGAAGNGAYELLKAIVRMGIQQYKERGLTDDSFSIEKKPNGDASDSKSNDK